MLKISRLSIENQRDNVITDESHPRISFALESDQTKVYLKEAKISVGSYSWTTDKQVAVPYEGTSLKPFSKYEVKVEAQDNMGERAQASMILETGRMDIPWEAEWISDASYVFKEKHVSPRPMTFRKTLNKSKSVREAKIYVTAMGIYEVLIDREKVGEDYFAPGYTSYNANLQYQVYDVSQQLKANSQVMVTVAGGWAVGAFNYKRVNRTWADRQALLFECHVTYDDGSMEVIGSDETWEVTEEGPLQAAEFYAGQVYDATINKADIHWRRATKETLRINPEIVATYGAMVRAHESFKPKFSHKSPSGMLIYDVGQNLAGVIDATIKGKKGQKIVFHHAEVLMDGELFTKPLRSAKQEAVYICHGQTKEETYSPRMTYMGFRYVGVEGIEQEDLNLSVKALYSDMPLVGHFSCSNERVNQLQNAIVWGAKSNFVDIPTDCPQRDERMGWTGDIAVFSPTAAYNFDTSRFLDKWLRDVKAEQRHGGGIPMVVPNSTVPMQWELMIPMAVDHWGDACVWVPWAEYQARGDRRILEKMYPTMKKYIKACKFWASFLSVGKHRRIWTLLHHYGDWCAPNVSMWGWMIKGRWTATAALARTSKNVAQIAEILGVDEDAAYYRTLSQETSEAYRSLLMEEDCSIKKEFQTGYVLPLHYQMLNEEDRKKTAAHLVKLVRKNDYHIATGFPGTPYILFALADNGYVEDAFKMLMTDTCPSWLYEVKAGGTTIWERWDALREDGTCNTGDDDGTNGMVSFNHYASGSVGAFLYQKIAGIRPLEAGYREFTIEPLMGGGLTEAEGCLESPYGKIVSHWTLEKNRFSIEVQVPVGTKCHLHLPEQSIQRLESGQHTIQVDL